MRPLPPRQRAFQHVGQLGRGLQVADHARVLKRIFDKVVDPPPVHAVDARDAGLRHRLLPRGPQGADDGRHPGQRTHSKRV